MSTGTEAPDLQALLRLLGRLERDAARLARAIEQELGKA